MTLDLAGRRLRARQSLRQRRREPGGHIAGQGAGSGQLLDQPSAPDDPDVVAAKCEYGGELNAAFRLGNVFATQFHPEKSGTAGLQLLANFVDVCAA